MTNESLTTTTGYFVWSSSGIGSPTDVDFVGTLNTGNQVVANLTYNAAPAGDGYNLVGNPYPSAVEWDATWTKSNIDATIYIYDGINYKTWNYNLGTGSLTNGEIPPTQGFWIKANAASPSMTIPNSARVHTSNGFYKSTSSLDDLLTISVSGNGYTDQTRIGILDDATYEFDGEYDAHKLFGIDDSPQLYTHILSQNFAVNILPDVSEYKPVLLNLQVGVEGVYELLAEELIGFSGLPVYLEDLQTGKIVNLKQNPNYKCFVSPDDSPNRFLLHFSDVEAPIDPSGIYYSDMIIYPKDKQVIITTEEAISAVVTITNLLGQQVAQGKMTNSNYIEFTIDGKKGCYIVNVMSDNGQQTKKVMIR